MKKIIAILLCMTILLTACSTPKQTNEFTADNEIFTYDKIDSSKTVITLGKVGNVYVDNTINEFMKLNPDIQVVRLEMTGGNDFERPWVEWLEKGYVPDVVMVSSHIIKKIPQEKYFEDLTDNPVVNLYQPSYLKKNTIDGKIFSLPSPSVVTGLYYNKNLFDEYGWKEPQNFDEFLVLCQQITEETNGEIRPWNANAKYTSGILNSLQGFMYGELFAGFDNRAWYQDFLKGEQSFESHMKPAYNILKEMFEKGFITVDDFSYSATQISKEFDEGKLAMFAAGTSQYYLDNGYVMIPFPSTDGKKGFLFEDVTFGMLKPIKERNEKQEDAVQKLLEYMSTKEAQNNYTDNSIAISCLVDNDDTKRGIPPFMLEAQIDGRIFTPLDFSPQPQPTQYAPYNILRDDMFAIAKGEMTSEQAMKNFDEKHREMLSGTISKISPTVAVATEDFTVLETSNYFADMFREKANADIGLCLNNATYRGNLMRIFKGDITEATVKNLLMRSLANDSTLTKANMTGEQLLKALEDTLEHDTNLNRNIFAVSGLKCKVAPWNNVGERYLEVTLADGTAIELNKEYTVAFWGGTVKEEYIGEIVETYEGKFTDLLTETLTQDKEITPIKDKRMTLIWE